MARPLAFPLLLLGLSVLACGGGDDVPEPWSRREGEQEVVVGNEGPSNPSPTTTDEGTARPAGPTTTTRVETPAPRNLPPVEESYPAVQAAKRIDLCPEGTDRVQGKGRQEEQYCVLPDTDMRHGPYMSVWGNGELHEVGVYVGGQRHGLWSEWHRSGKLAGTWRWEDGQPKGKVEAP